MSADIGKGSRVTSEVFLGWWLAHLGLARDRAGSRTWLLVTLAGAWTVLVGVWTFLDASTGLKAGIARLHGPSSPVWPGDGRLGCRPPGLQQSRA